MLTTHFPPHFSHFILESSGQTCPARLRPGVYIHRAAITLVNSSDEQNKTTTTTTALGKRRKRSVLEAFVVTADKQERLCINSQSAAAASGSSIEINVSKTRIVMRRPKKYNLPTPPTF
jgi:hypothetical protein